MSESSTNAGHHAPIRHVGTRDISTAISGWSKIRKGLNGHSRRGATTRASRLAIARVLHKSAKERALFVMALGGIKNHERTSRNKARSWSNA